MTRKRALGHDHPPPTRPDRQRQKSSSPSRRHHYLTDHHHSPSRRRLPEADNNEKVVSPTEQRRHREKTKKRGRFDASAKTRPEAEAGHNSQLNKEEGEIYRQEGLIDDDHDVEEHDSDDDEMVDEEEHQQLTSAVLAWAKSGDNTPGPGDQVAAGAKAAVKSTQRAAALTDTTGNPTDRRGPSAPTPRRRPARPPTPPGDNHTPNAGQKWSLYVQQVAYQATRDDLLHFFQQKGPCRVRSVRLVYDHDQHHVQTFRGVAFVDLLDADSYRQALVLDGQLWRGRRLRIRPTCTVQQLSALVQNRVQAAWRAKESKEEEAMVPKKKSPPASGVSQVRRTTRSPQSPASSGRRLSPHPAVYQPRGSQTTSATPPPSDPPATTATSADPTGSSAPDRSKMPRKDPTPTNHQGRMTKKERNRRAAIILQRTERQQRPSGATTWTT